jgi:uncharacterized damage-inducible protein DinB
MRTMKNAIVTFGVVLVMGASAASAQAPTPPPPQAAAKPRPPQSFPMYLQGQYDTLKRNIMGSAEKMPIEHFAFKPTPEVMSYGRLFGHTMETQYSYCNAVKGGVNPAAGKDFEKVLDKATVIQMVKDSFAYCDDAFAGLTNANALEMITVGIAPNQRQIARANQLTQLIVHGNEHYGNMVTYMRIKGIVPPSSAQ